MGHACCCKPPASYSRIILTYVRVVRAMQQGGGWGYTLRPTLYTGNTALTSKRKEGVLFIGAPQSQAKIKIGDLCDLWYWYVSMYVYMYSPHATTRHTVTHTRPLGCSVAYYIACYNAIYICSIRCYSTRT